jgi:hypothetical protein
MRTHESFLQIAMQPAQRPDFYECEHCLYFCIYEDPNRQRHLSSKRHNLKVSKALGISMEEAMQLSLRQLNGRPQRHSYVQQNMINLFRVELLTADDEPSHAEDFWILTEDPGHDEPEPEVIPLEIEMEIEDPVPVHFQTELAQVASLMGWECAVCMESLAGDRFHLTPCFHKVCRVCVSKVDRCPVCRRDW